jgi:hypothetical protein
MTRRPCVVQRLFFGEAGRAGSALHCLALAALLGACADDAPGGSGEADAASDVPSERDLTGDGPGPLDAGDAGDAAADGGDSGDSGDGGDGDGGDGGEPSVGLTIAWDYRFDSRGFFATAAARGVLEEAARQWGVRLRDDFEAIPAGTTIYVRNPQDTSQEAYLTLESPIDDLLVFVGAAPRASSAAGASATALFPAEQDDPELRAALMERWEGDDFEPWTAWIQFNSEREWFFDTSFETGDDIPPGTTDALSTALHELGHVLGIAPGGAFERLVEDGHFVGPRAVAVYGGPVPLADVYGHIAEDVTIDGQTPIMATGRIRGQRYAITRLDLAMLADLGYELE